MTSHLPSFFRSCVSFLAKNEAGLLGISSKELNMPNFIESQHCLPNCSEKSRKKPIKAELLTKNCKKNVVGSKIRDFCMGSIYLASAARF